jgi:hypothetical protein
MAVKVPRLILFEMFRAISVTLIAFVQCTEGIRCELQHSENGQ